MEKIFVFIDGGYLDKITQPLKIRLDMSKLAMKLCDGTQYVRTYYYHCLPYQHNPPTDLESEFFAKASSFFDKLKKLGRFEVRLGKLVKRGISVDGNPIYNQKRVDVYLATDLVKFSAQKSMDKAIILTSDSDYVPAVQAAKEFGSVVKLAYYKNLPINDELKTCCDEFNCFEDNFFNDLKR